MDNIPNLDRRLFSSKFLRKASEIARVCGVSRGILLRIKALVRSCRIDPRSIHQATVFERKRERIAHSLSCQSSAAKSRIHIMYVTYEGDFRLFLTSLLSLEAVRSGNIGNIYVLEDSSKPISSRNKEILRLTSSSSIEFIYSRFPLADRGPGLVASELLAFKQIASVSGGNDYLAKVDSDTVFVSDKAFSTVLTSGADILGARAESWSPLVYVQGGCYFVRCGIVPQMFTIPILPVLKRVARRTWNLTTATVPEDGVIHELVCRSKGRALYLDDLYCPWWKTLACGEVEGTVAHLRKASRAEYAAFISQLDVRFQLQEAEESARKLQSKSLVPGTGKLS